MPRFARNDKLTAMTYTNRINSKEFSSLTGVSHAFLTRRIDKCTHVYTTLDAKKAQIDNPAHVISSNLDRARENFGFDSENISMMLQTHSTRVAVVDGTVHRPEHDVDAQVTTVPGAALGVLTADCVPVLLADAKHRVIGAVHAGWKGTCAGVLEATIQKMISLGAVSHDIHAVIGPCIRWDSYEVGPDFVKAFEHVPSFKDFLKPSPNPGRQLFDLPGMVRFKLRALDLANVFDIEVDTYTNPDLCFSYRRQTHRGEGFQGNLLSVVMLTANPFASSV